MSFQCDEAKNARNIEKHGIDFATAKDIFRHPTLEWPDTRPDYGEDRFIAIGIAHGLVMVVYTWRGDDTRLISARRAHEKERQQYRQEFPYLFESGSD
jgi:uncharacterized protein